MHSVGTFPAFLNSQPAAAAASMDPLGRFLQIIHNSLKDVPGFEIQQNFEICNKWTPSRARGVVDLHGIKEALEFLVSKLSNDQLINAWASWAKEHHDRALVEFLAYEYFDRVAPSDILEDLSDPVEHIHQCYSDLPDCHPVAMGIISVAFERGYFEDCNFVEYVATIIDEMLKDNRMEEVLNSSHHLFAYEPLARLFSTVAFHAIFCDKDDRKGMEILTTNHNVIFDNHKYFSAVDDLHAFLCTLFDDKTPPLKQTLVILKHRFPEFKEVIVPFLQKY